MGKRTQTATEPKGSQSSSVATVKSTYDDLVGKVANANSTMSTARERKSELIAAAVKDDKLHKTAFSWVMKLRKMDPVARNELLFHFDVYCDYEKFAREDLLSDRGGESGGEEPETPTAGTGDEDAVDLRPGFLRQPGASVTSVTEAAVSKIKDDALNKVGRGKPN